MRLRLHAYPVLGAKELRQVKPSTVQTWLRGLDGLAASYRRVIYANVSGIFAAAVDDELLPKNPCRAASVRRPKVNQRKVVPWPVEQVLAVEAALSEKWRIVATLASGLGLRQGEVFGLSPDDVDFLRGRVEVRRQVKVYANNKQAFALPKGRKVRTVPLPDSVRDDLAAYLAKFPAVPVTLPWENLDGKPVTVPLVVTSRERTAPNRNYFNAKVWKPALAEAGIDDDRHNGCHALRHFYASVLLDAGESIKAVSEYLGHSDPGFTLRVYTHLMPSSEDRTRKAVDAVRRPTDQATEAAR
jgi:integrase